MTLPYELAVELANAGFPQYETGDFYHSSLSNPKPSDFVVDTEKTFDRDVYIPTLEELVEACGDSFDCLMKQDGVWVVNHANHAHDSTPSEAVARLWLSLNRKT